MSHSNSVAHFISHRPVRSHIWLHRHLADIREIFPLICGQLIANIAIPWSSPSLRGLYDIGPQLLIDVNSIL